MRSIVDRVWFYGKRQVETIVYSCIDWAVVSTYWVDTQMWIDTCIWVDN